LHIAFYSSAWPETAFPGGIIRYVAFQHRELIARGHKVSIVTGKIDDTGTEASVRVVTLSPFEKLFRRFYSKIDPAHAVFAFGNSVAKAFRALHKACPIDVIEIEESFGWSQRIQSKLDVPVVLRLHGPIFLAELEENKSGAFLQARIKNEGIAIKAAEAITAPSFCALDETLKFYNARPAISAHIRNPMSLPHETPLWDLDGCSKDTVLFVGRFDQIKGGDVVLHAFKKLLETQPNLKLLFVGSDVGIPSKSGRIHFSDYVTSIFPESQRRQICYFGVKPQAEICEMRAKSVVTLVASVWESCAYTALEAMIQRCPLVAINNGGVGEQVEDSSTGLLANPDNLDHFCSQIGKILADPALGRQLGEAARERVLQDHSPALIARQSEDFYIRAREHSS
jgi:glycosyltransferase involved in cell wall biosynthesis